MHISTLPRADVCHTRLWITRFPLTKLEAGVRGVCANYHRAKFPSLTASRLGTLLPSHPETVRGPSLQSCRHQGSSRAGGCRSEGPTLSLLERWSTHHSQPTHRPGRGPQDGSLGGSECKPASDDTLLPGPWVSPGRLTVPIDGPFPLHQAAVLGPWSSPAPPRAAKKKASFLFKFFPPCIEQIWGLFVHSINKHS